MNQQELEEKLSALSRIDSHKEGIKQLTEMVKNDDIIPESNRDSGDGDKRFMLYMLNSLQHHDETRLRELDSLEVWTLYYLHTRAHYKKTQAVKG